MNERGGKSVHTPLELHQMAVAARRRGDLICALDHLRAGVALDPGTGIIQLWLQHGDVLRETGETDEAVAAYRRIAAAHPGNFWGHQRLAQMARRRGDPGAALVHLETALRVDPGRLNLHLDMAQILLDTARFDQAVVRLESLRADHGPQAQVMLLLARAYRGLRQADRAESCLEDLIAADPLDLRLLRHLCAIRANAATKETFAQVLELIRERLGDGLALELELQARLRRLEFEEVLQTLRRTPSARRSAAEAQTLERALFGAHHYAISQRYLRFCLRRWPENPALWSAYVLYRMRFGHLSEAAALLEAGQGVFPRHLILSHRLKLCGYRGDLQGAVDCYAELQTLGQPYEAQRAPMTELIFNLADLDEIDAIFARIGNPAVKEGRPLHRGGLPGMMAMECELERRELAGKAGSDTLEDWVRAKPGSSMAAIRLIDAWRGQTPPVPPDPGGGDPVPRRIFQYWDTAAPPESIARMTDSWARAPGFTHQVLDRAAGLAFLRETYSSQWVDAFRLAHNPAQEADLLRLCLLWHSGGIWADADDYLYGDLDRVLGQGRGLILYRETLGGALGNNFIAAPPGHPVIAYAARLACKALLERSFEIAWTKTGPGPLTRAVGQYLVHAGPDAARAAITVLDWPKIANEISTHNPVLYKTSKTYWANSERRVEKHGIWDQLLAAIQARPGRA